MRTSHHWCSALRMTWRASRRAAKRPAFERTPVLPQQTAAWITLTKAGPGRETTSRLKAPTPAICVTSRGARPQHRHAGREEDLDDAFSRRGASQEGIKRIALMRRRPAGFKEKDRHSRPTCLPLPSAHSTSLCQPSSHVCRSQRRTPREGVTSTLHSAAAGRALAQADAAGS